MAHITIPVFLINLPSSADRRARMNFQLRRLGITYRLVDAVYGAALDSSVKKTIEQNRDHGLYRKSLSDGEIGCALSHVSVYKIIADEKIPCALILEDDVFIDPVSVELLQTQTLARLPADWDVLFCAYVQRGNLYSKPYRRAHLRYYPRTVLTSPRGARFTVGIPTEFCYHAAGYIVSLKGARNLYATGIPVRMPADILTGNARAFGMRAYALRTPCMRQHLLWAQDSTIKDACKTESGVKQYIKRRARSNGVFALITLVGRALFLLKNSVVAAARGFVFPVRLLRKLGVVPEDVMKPCKKFL